MSDVKVTTNNVPRDVLYWYELTPAERGGFEYYTDTDTRRAEFQAFRYRGEVYDLGDFMSTSDRTLSSRTPDVFDGWDGYQPDSFFSGIVVRYVENYEAVIVGRYYFS